MDRFAGDFFAAGFFAGDFLAAVFFLAGLFAFEAGFAGLFLAAGFLGDAAFFAGDLCVGTSEAGVSSGSTPLRTSSRPVS